MSKIFLLYRPGESDEASYAIHEVLSERFSNKCFLLPAQDQTAGLDVWHIIEPWSVFLVVIGPHWQASADQYGNLQLLKPTDSLRQILSRALTMSKVLVLPVRVEGAAMPAFQDLPPDLAQLHYRNAATVRKGLEFYQDIDRIIRSIRAFWPIRKRWSYPRLSYVLIFGFIGDFLLSGLFGIIMLAVSPASPNSGTLQQSAEVPSYPGLFIGVAVGFLYILLVIGMALLLVGVWLTVLILTIRIRRWGWFFFVLFCGIIGMPLFVYFGPVSRPRRKR